MSKPKVIVTNEIPEKAVKFLSAHTEAIYLDRGATQEELISKIHDVEGLLTGGFQVDEALLRHAPKLKIVSNIMVGYNNFAIDDMKKYHVLGTHTPYVLDTTVADLIITLMLVTSRRVCELDQYIRDGKWNPEDGVNLFGVNMTGKKLGIIGMGRIGETVARKAIGGFDMEVRYYNRSQKLENENNLNIQYAPMDEVLSQSDFVVVMTPLTDQTRGLIGKRELALMQKTAILVNASRGPVVNENELILALRNQTILGAGLDVFEQEPIQKDNELLAMKNVVLTPHIGSATAETRLDMAMVAAENLVDGLYGRTPKYVVPELRQVVL